LQAELEFEWSRSSPHNLPNNGSAERANQSLLNQITRLLEEGFTLEESIELGAALYNNTVHTATGATPYSLVFGKPKNEPDLVEQAKHSRVDLLGGSRLENDLKALLTCILGFLMIF
jgi:hypothetical protein